MKLFFLSLKAYAGALCRLCRANLRFKINFIAFRGEIWSLHQQGIELLSCEQCAYGVVRDMEKIQDTNKNKNTMPQKEHCNPIHFF